LAFSLIEILITVGLLSFIILGLMLMFNQVQRAFRSSMTQTDVLEAGRAVADMMARELEEMTPTQIRANAPGVLNFMAELENKTVDGNFAFDDPLRQFLPGATVPRTNYVQRIFFMSKVNQDYVGTGYVVVPHYTNSVTDVAVGTLYQYAVATNKAWASTLPRDFINASTSLNNLHRVADGVVHLRLRAFDVHGALITPNTQGTHNITAQWENNILASQYVADQTRYYFYSNAVPAHVELEIAFLEPHLLDRYKAIEDSDFAAGLTAVPHARNYLSNQVANVHLFRRRIPIHNVDFAAYQ